MPKHLAQRVLLLVRSMRPHQWAKNLLLFVAAMGDHRLDDTAVLVDALVAFLAFCAVASMVYLVNDVIDRESDWLHTRKRQRPIAAGLVSPGLAFATAALLGLAGLGLALTLPLAFQVTLALYVTVSIVYMLGAKRIVAIDTVLLASLFTLRLYAGGAATAIELSFWLLAFAVFMFTGLAFLKRYAELRDQAGNPTCSFLPGRGYQPDDAPVVGMLGVGAGMASLLVLSLYIQSEEVVERYASPELIWVLVPVMLYWQSRMWLAGHRGTMGDDPILFALRDRPSLLAGFLTVVTVFLAI